MAATGQQNTAFQSIEQQITQIGSDLTTHHLDQPSIAQNIGFGVNPAKVAPTSAQATVVVNEILSTDRASIAYLQSFQGEADPNLLSQVESFFQMDVSSLTADLPGLSVLDQPRDVGGGLTDVQALLFDEGAANDIDIAYQDLQTMAQLTPNSLGGGTPTPPPTPPPPAPPPKPTTGKLSIVATDANKQLVATQGTTPTPFTFTVTRSGDTSQAATATYAVTGSGSNPTVASDFQGSVFPTGTVLFDVGQASATISIPVGNHIFSGSPNVGFTVTATGSANSATATGNIQEVPPPTIDQYADLASGVYDAGTATAGSGGSAGQSITPATIDGYSIPTIGGALFVTGTNITGRVAPGTPNGFFGAAYQDGNQVVIAFRGTDLGNLSNLVNNIFGDDSAFATNTVTTQAIADDIASAAQFVEKVKATFLKANITITGHSLGGGFAQIVGQAAGLSSTVFNAPGGNKFIPLAGLNLPGVRGGWPNSDRSISGISA